MMNASQTSNLDHLEFHPPTSHPRIAELLVGKAMPGPGDLTPVNPLPTFTAALPAASKAPKSTRPRTPELIPLPSPTTLREVVSSAMDELPVAMPAPVIKPVAEKPTIVQPLPLPQETPTEAKLPVFDPPTTKRQAIEPAPATTPFISASTTVTKENQNTSQTAQTKPEAAPSFPDTQGTLPGFENLEQPTTDNQLVEALLPIVESSLEKALNAPKTGLHMYLEPMLRATVRRAIAEQMQTIHHFGQINAIDRITWRFKALFTSRTYDDIVFDRTRRYRVEEVYLLRYDSNELVSYASHDPSRHATPRKIKYDLSRLVEELKGEDGELRKSFELPNHNNAVVRCGQDCFLLASVRGPINALVRADLDYVLSQIEQRFGDRLRDKGEQFIHVLQPILEGCLLIQSPPPPR